MSPLAAFRRVFNLRMVAAVYYFCLLYAVSRALMWLGGGDKAWPDLLFEMAYFNRQTLITGLAMLLSVALAEAVLAGRAWPLRTALPVQALAVACGASLGLWGRYLAGKSYNPGLTVELSWVLSNLAIWTLLGAAAYALLRLTQDERATIERLRRLEREREALREGEAQAQVSALNAQIEPHFLFNSLANVKRLYETQPERGRDMLSSLINYLRAALPGMRSAESTLGNELELVRNYLSILQMRMGERLQFDIDAQPALLQERLPPMVLPTLVENAIKHGLSPLPEGGHIEIVARRCGPGAWADSWAVEVRDNGRGFAPGSSGTGVGLANTRARLAALFGDAAALELEAGQPRGVIARVRLPMVLA